MGHCRRLYRRDRHCREGRRPDAVYHEREIHLPAVESDEILFREPRHEDRLQHFGVKRPDAEGDRRAHVAEHGIAHLLLHLFDVLVRNDEIQFIFARFGENLGKCLVREVLEFVDVEIKMGQLGEFAAGEIRTAHRGEEYARREHRAQKAHVGLADEPFREIDDEYFPFIHHLADIERGLRLADDVADERIAGELTDLVLDRGRRLLRIAVGVIGKLLRPEVFHDRVLHVLNDFLPIRLVGVHAIDAEQGRIRILEEREQCVGENVFHARAPRVHPNLFERRHEAADHEWRLS